ncbi:MAG: AI-2E family transporter [Acidobacteriota bacterium]|jgi:predicted PurR-regulated permease PerM|nr:AI-2E family transporter [Acidobacteriota bacterium]
MAEKKISEEKQSEPIEILREKRQIVRRVYLDPSTPSVRSIVRVVLITLVLLFIMGFVTSLLVSLTHLFFLIVLSVFFAYLIDPLVKLIRRPFKERQLEKLMPRPAAIFIAYLIVFSILGLAIASLAPRVIEQSKEFAANLPDYATSIQKSFSEIGTRYQYQIPQPIQDDITAKISTMIGDLGTFITSFVFGSLLVTIILYLPWLVLVPVLAFFFLKDVNLFRVAFLRVFPSGRWRGRAEAVLSDVNKTLAAYTRAQLISCLIIGVICTAGFYIIGLKYALLFGILAGVLEFIPLIGPLTMAIIAITVSAFSDNPWKALYVAIFLIVLRILQDYIFYPRIVREGIHLHPLAIILSVLAGEQIAGIPGVFLSIPLVALLTVLYKHILEHSGSTGFFSGWLEPKEVSEEVK